MTTSTTTTIRINITTGHALGSTTVRFTIRPAGSARNSFEVRSFQRRDIALDFGEEEDAERAAERAAGLWTLVEAQVVLRTALAAAGRTDVDTATLLNFEP